jgi:hypothetical protein
MPNSTTKQTTNASGFTLLGVIVATFVLTAGLFTTAIVTGKVRTPGRRKYMTFASMLASEKLDDLSRGDRNDPNVCVPAGSNSAGSLTADLTQTTTCLGGASDRVSYFDDITMRPGGSYSETISSTSGGVPVYVTTVHAADGSISISTSDVPPDNPPTFHRRWIIERKSSATGGRQTTVLVTTVDRTVEPPVIFQMSTR